MVNGKWVFGPKCAKAYKPPTGGHCEKEEVMCTARDGKFVGRKICVGKKFQYDNYLQCEDGKDEEQCEEEYTKKGIFKRDQRIICRSPFLRISNEKNETGKFFPMRAIRFIILILIIIIIIIDHDVFRCDMIPQCPHGEDEEGCHIPESARLVMSLFITNSPS